jgi:hypothetical protein
MVSRVTKLKETRSGNDAGTALAVSNAAGRPAVVRRAGRHHPNNLLLMAQKDARVSYPYFFSPAEGRFSSLVEIPSMLLGRDHKIRGYLPPGYDENTLSRFPVVYMQDGQNLFFPEEAFQGHDWKVDKTGDVRRAMNAGEDFLILDVLKAQRRGITNTVI